MNDLASRLNAVMDAFPAKTALYCMDLTTGTPIAAIRENTRVVSASTIKVSILCCALQDVMDGKLSLDDPASLLRRFGDSLFAQPCDRRFHVAVSFGQGFFAVHHARAGSVAQFFN